MDLTLTMTATLRPELLKVTLESFHKNLFKDIFQTTHLVVNIDPTGHNGTNKDKHDRVEEILRILSLYSFKSNTINVPEEPHFGHAFRWVISKIKTEYFFHLEEDWNLIQATSFRDMLSLFEEDPNLVHLRLSQFPSVNGTMKTWNKFMKWNGKYFEVPYELKGGLGWAGHPSLNRTTFMKGCIQYSNPNGNPEKQLKLRRYSPPSLIKLYSDSTFGIYHPYNAPRSVVDIGRQWMIKNKFAKKGTKAFFTTWEKV